MGPGDCGTGGQAGSGVSFSSHHWGFVKVNRARLVRYSLYAGATAAVAATAIWLEWQAVSQLWSWVVGFAEENWRRAFGGRGRLLMYFGLFMLLEVCFLAWQNTTVFIIFVQRKLS